MIEIEKTKIRIRLVTIGRTARVVKIMHKQAARRNDEWARIAKVSDKKENNENARRRRIRYTFHPLAGAERESL